MLKKYIHEKFGITEEKFLEVLKMSPGAEGYLLGSLGELLFKEYANSIGYEALRIKEKPEGGDNAKSEDARGDFYIKKKDSKKDEWYVVECKGVKSNSEKRLNLTIKNSCFNFLRKHSVARDSHLKSILDSGKSSYKTAKAIWEKKHKNKKFPKFRWNEDNPGAGIPDLSELWETEEEIQEWLDSFNADSFSETAYWDLTAPIRLIQTHMPSSRVDPVTNIKSTGPLVTEFNILCLDLFIRTGKHEFVFVNAAELNHQAKSPNHLQQNYTIDILTAKDNFQRHELLKPWYSDLEKCINESNPTPRKLDESQLDYR